MFFFSFSLLLFQSNKGLDFWVGGFWGFLRFFLHLKLPSNFSHRLIQLRLHLRKRVESYIIPSSRQCPLPDLLPPPSNFLRLPPNFIIIHPSYLLLVNSPGRPGFELTLSKFRKIVLPGLLIMWKQLLFQLILLLFGLLFLLLRLNFFALFLSERLFDDVLYAALLRSWVLRSRAVWHVVNHSFGLG